MGVLDQQNLRRDVRNVRVGRERMEQMQQRIKNLKENDPEAYKKEKERQDRVRNRIADALWEQKQFVEAIDPSTLSEDFRLNHEALLSKLQKINTQMAEVIEDPDSQDAWKTRREMFGLFMAAVPMLEKERQIVLYDLGRSIGYSDDDASVFADTVEYINEMTSPRLIMKTLRESHKDEGHGAQAP